MAENADGLIAVWDGSSRGTLSMIELARTRGLRVFVFRLDGAAPEDSGPEGEVAARWTAGRAAPPRRVEAGSTSSQEGSNLHAAAERERAKYYRLNALLASFPPDAVVILGRQPYRDRDQLDELRAQLRETHLVKRSREVIECVGYDAHSEVIGERHEARLIERPDLTQSLLREWLARSLARYGVRRGRGGMICYVSERPESNLLNDALVPGIRLPDGVGRRIAVDFDVRRIRGSSGQPRLVIAIDVCTRITLDCPLTALVDIGLDPRGLYVQRDVTTTKGSRRCLAGRVRHVEQGTLLLDDHDPDVRAMPMADAWLEPRVENFERVVHAAAGPRAVNILARLQNRVAERLGGKARLVLVDEWVAAIRRLPDDVAQGIRVRFDKTVLRADGARFPNFEVYEKPRLVFDVGLTKTAVSNQSGLDKFGPYNFERFPTRRPNIAIICQASRQGDVERFVQQLLEGVPGSKWAGKGLVRRYHLERPMVRTFVCRSPSAAHYREAVAAAIDDATTRNEKWHLALIQTDASSHELRGDENPYLITKALFLTYQIPTQAFVWDSIRPGMNIDATVNNIGLAVYAKLGGTPWLLPVHQTVAHELVVGLGSFLASESRLGHREKYIGVSTVFSASGRYFLESRTPATPESEYVQALLSALERAIDFVRRSEGWTTDDRIRLVFHVFKDFNRTEIQAVKQLMVGLGFPHAEFAFVHLVEAHPFMLFDPSEPGIGERRPKGVATAPRGLRVDLDDNEALVCLKGASDLRRWSDGSPKPMLLRLHPASTFKDLSYLARQVFDFTFLSWRTMFGSSHPMTVLYADLVAEQLLRLRDVSIWSPETILGPVGRSRWFL
ncbi:argonaute/piwi family protein [Sorangium sp. So ce1151]|uniref:argonaute/piwi family protein n=1 Tax=Sorangium sp. So ce1151 TaxID=3133332 RepID=UPI003F63A88C